MEPSSFAQRNLCFDGSGKGLVDYGSQPEDEVDDKDGEVKDSDMASTTPENSARALLPSNSIV